MKGCKMPKPKVTKEQAEAVLLAIKERYPESLYCDPPTLYPHDHEDMPEGCWSIAWEGAPEDWVDHVSGMWDDGIKVPGVFLEPMTSWCLGLYPA
jgi:hypothetical protein